MADNTDLPDKIIDEANTKTFQCHGILLFLDNKAPGCFYEECSVDFVNPVPVKDDEGKLIGAATLNISGKVVEAEFFLDYHTPQRLDIENQNGEVYPSIVTAETLDNVEGTWRVAECRIIEVHLVREPQPDPRIEAL